MDNNENKKQEDYKKLFSNIQIVKDETNGLVQLSLIRRIEQDRNTKVRNNFSGQQEKASAKLLFELLAQLNEKLPEKKGDEVMVGLLVSGLVMASTLAIVRDSQFTYSIRGKYSGYEKAFSFSEEHRNNTEHYIYGIKPGDSVILVEDEVTSGNGLVSLVKALEEYGVTVIAVSCILETLNFGARENIKNSTGFDLFSLITTKLS